MNQALLTGEAYPVEKHPRGAEGRRVRGRGNDRYHFMGTSVVSGTATRPRSSRTGRADRPRGDRRDGERQGAGVTAFEHGTQAFGLLIMRITLLLVLPRRS